MRGRRWASVISLGVMMAMLFAGSPVTAQDSAPPDPADAGVQAGAVETLYDQMDSPSTDLLTRGVISQNFETEFNGFDSQAADDFFIPSGDSGSNWAVSTLSVRGYYFGSGSQGTGPADSVNVFFYADRTSGGVHLPGTTLYSGSAIAIAADASGSFTVNLPAPVTLTTTTDVGAFYWVSVQANQSATLRGQWAWLVRTVQSNQASAWINPLDQAGTPCDTWKQRVKDCAQGKGGVDLTFILTGTNNLINAGPLTFNINPIAATVGSANVQLTVNGANFVKGPDAVNSSKILWNGVEKATTVNGTNSATITIPASDLYLAGTATITVKNPNSKVSNPQIFQITGGTILLPLVIH